MQLRVTYLGGHAAGAFVKRTQMPKQNEHLFACQRVQRYDRPMHVAHAGLGGVVAFLQSALQSLIGKEPTLSVLDHLGRCPDKDP